ncbi:DMT family transporter [Cyclobacterium sediminis]
MVKDYLWLHLVVLIWGFTAILGLLISLPAVEIVFYRTMLAGAGLYFLLKFKKRNIRVRWNALLKFLVTGGLIGAHWILFFWAAQVSTASVCLAGMATCSLWTAIIEPIVNKQAIKWYEVLLGLIVIVGLIVIFKFESGYSLGLFLAVVSALLSACFTVINGRLTKSHSPFIITFYEMIGAFVLTTVFIPFYINWFAEAGFSWVPKGLDWFWLLVLSQVCTVIAFTLSVNLMKRLTAFAVNLTVNMEPVYGILLAFIIFGEKEKMTPEFYLGTLIILASVCIYPLIRYVQKRRLGSTPRKIH